MNTCLSFFSLPNGKDLPDVERPPEQDRPDFEKDVPDEPDRPDIPPLPSEDKEDVRRRDLPVARS